jgi:hypothetical protein
MTGVMLFGFAGTTALAFVLYRSANWMSAAIVFMAPPGWYTMQASADAAGAASAAYPGFSIFLRIVLSAFLHLEAALVVLGSWLPRRCGIRWVFVPLLMGVVACVAQRHLQVRYFLPGMAMLAAGVRQ